jgi:hypothetical protein
MTTTKHLTKPVIQSVSTPLSGKRSIDPILQEVYDIKARLNAEAGYSVQKILERARRNAAPLATKR